MILWNSHSILFEWLHEGESKMRGETPDGRCWQYSRKAQGMGPQGCLGEYGNRVCGSWQLIETGR